MSTSFIARNVITAGALATIAASSFVLATSATAGMAHRADGVGPVTVTVSGSVDKDPLRDGSESSVSVTIETPLTPPVTAGVGTHQYGDPLCPVPNPLCAS